MSEPILGIDLGTTNSAVGVVESGFPILLANTENQRIIPSAVWYGENGEVEVGFAALRRRAASTGGTITSVKRLIGTRSGDVPNFPFPVEQSNGRLTISPYPGKSVTPVEVSAEILKHLKSIAEQRLEVSVSKAVITVPAYFNDAQRAATKQAGELAGLQVERIVSEPTAAALAFGLDKLSDKARVIVYDLGGGTFDVSLLEMANGIFQVEATSGDTHLGGDDIDIALAEWAWESFDSANFNTIDFATRQRVISEAQKVKEQLSTQKSATFAIPFLRDGRSLSTDITRETFNSLIKPWIDKTLRHCRQVLLDAQIKTAKESISHVILVGGSTRIPMLQQCVSEFFEISVNLTQHPDEAIALGAVIQGGILSGALRDIVLLDVTPLSLGIETYGGLMNVIIPRNTTIPCKAGEMFTNAVDAQQEMTVRVLQGERELAKDNWNLGKITVPFEPTRKGQARVGVQFSIDENGILEVLTRDTQTQKDSILKIDSAAVDVADEKVEAMVSESVEYAFEDMAERVFTEAKLKAEELLPAVDHALAQVGNQLDDTTTEKIQSLQLNIKEHIMSKDANQLKTCVQQLDKATEELATILVEQAMEAALMRKLEE